MSLAADAASRVRDLHELKDAVRAGPGPRATEAQPAKGKPTGRQRLDLLFDKGTFTEVEALRRHRATAFGLDRKRPHTDGVGARTALAGYGGIFRRNSKASGVIPQISVILRPCTGGAVATRRSLITALSMVSTKHKPLPPRKHGNPST